MEPAQSSDLNKPKLRDRLMTEPLLNDDVDPDALRRLADVIFQSGKTPHETNIVKILDAVLPHIKKEGPLVEIAEKPVAIYGDLLGNKEFFRLHKLIDSQINRVHIFLGNYLGDDVILPQALLLVFILKCLHPDQHILLRGSNETWLLSWIRTSLDTQFDERTSEYLERKFVRVFNYMPLACAISGEVLCMHGGISPHLKSLDDIRKIPLPLMFPNGNQLAWDLLNAAPMWNLKGFKTNPCEDTFDSVYFGRDVLEETMKRLDIGQIVRSNEIMQNGNGFFHGQRLVTLSTVPAYDDRENKAAVLLVGADRVAYFLYGEATRDSAMLGKVFKGDLPVNMDFSGFEHAVNEKEDANYVVDDDAPQKPNTELEKCGDFAIEIGDE